MGRIASLSLFLLLILASAEEENDCSSKTKFTLWKCDNKAEFVPRVDDSPPPSCSQPPTFEAGFEITPLSATHWIIQILLPKPPITGEWNLKIDTPVPPETFQNWKDANVNFTDRFRFPFDLNKSNNIYPLYKWKYFEINSTTDLFNAFKNSAAHYNTTLGEDKKYCKYPLDDFWKSLARRYDFCHPSTTYTSTAQSTQVFETEDNKFTSDTVSNLTTSYAKNVTSKPISTVRIESSTDVIPIEKNTDSPHSASAFSATDAGDNPTSQSVVSLPTFITTTSVLSLIILILIVCAIILWIKLRRSRRRLEKKCLGVSLPTSTSVPSSGNELDRNSRKKATWENQKSKERRSKQEKTEKTEKSKEGEEKKAKNEKKSFLRTQDTLGSFDQ